MWSRIARMLRWPMTTALVVLVVWWPATRWYSVDWVTPPLDGHSLWVRTVSGQLVIISTDAPTTPGFHAIRHDSAWSWWFRWDRDSSGAGLRYTLVAIPLWAVVLALGAAAALVWRRHLTPPPGVCRCGYAIGASPVCTECGRKVALARAVPSEHG